MVWYHKPEGFMLHTWKRRDMYFRVCQIDVQGVWLLAKVITLAWRQRLMLAGQPVTALEDLYYHMRAIISCGLYFFSPFFSAANIVECLYCRAANISWSFFPCWSCCISPLFYSPTTTIGFDGEVFLQSVTKDRSTSTCFKRPVWLIKSLEYIQSHFDTS